MKVWITKFALTKGIFTAEAEICKEIDDRMIQVAGKAIPGCSRSTYFKPDWHETERSARLRAIEMAQRALKSLTRKEQKLKASIESWHE
jgi:hypothetical protein